MRGRRPGRAGWLIAGVVLLGIIVSAAGVGLSRASFSDSTSNPLNQLSLLTVGTPGSQTSAGCSPIAVSWTAATNATAYRVEAKTAAGSWTVLTASTASLTYNDATTYVNKSVTHRFTPLITGTSWEGDPVTTTPIVCGVGGIGEVTDLAVTNPCSASRVTFTAPAGSNNYDLEISVNGGGAWTVLATNTAVTAGSPVVFEHTLTLPAGYPTTNITPGINPIYRVTPGSGAANGTAATTTFTNWQNFRVTNVTFGNGGVLGTVGAGDSVVVTFSKPAAAKAVSHLNLLIIRTTRRIAYVAASASNAAGTQIGIVNEGTNNTWTNATRTHTGTTDVAPGGLTWTWTWVSSSGATTMSREPTVTTGWSLGTQANRAKCLADSTFLQLTPAPTYGTAAANEYW